MLNPHNSGLSQNKFNNLALHVFLGDEPSEKLEGRLVGVSMDAGSKRFKHNQVSIDAEKRVHGQLSDGLALCLWNRL